MSDPSDRIDLAKPPRMVVALARKAAKLAARAFWQQERGSSYDK